MTRTGPHINKPSKRLMEPQPSLEIKLSLAFPGITVHAMAEFRKIAEGNTDIDGKSLDRLGLVYRSNWKRNQWSLTSEGLKFARLVQTV